VEEHITNYRAARALTDKGRRRSGRGFQEQRKEGRQEVRGEEAETKEVTLATAFSGQPPNYAETAMVRQAQPAKSQNFDLVLDPEKLSAVVSILSSDPFFIRTATWL
jgi:hypothetical protein